MAYWATNTACNLHKFTSVLCHLQPQIFIDQVHADGLGLTFKGYRQHMFNFYYFRIRKRNHILNCYCSDKTAQQS